MPISQGLHARHPRVLITAHCALSVKQLANDLDQNRSLEISTATSIESLWRQIQIDRPAALLLDTCIAGVKTPQLVRDLIERTQLPILLRTQIDSFPKEVLLDSIEAGALGILDKPTSAEQSACEIPSLIWNLKAASEALMENAACARSTEAPPTNPDSGTTLFAIGGGLGSASSLSTILRNLPVDAPATVVIAPLPARLIPAWAHRISEQCQVSVTPAQDGDVMKPRQVLVAPGNSHLLLRRSGADTIVKIKDGPAVFHNKPSIELLFNSIAETCAQNAVGVLLSAAGMDGVAGLLQLRKAGGLTLTESPNNCLFPDLPARAIQCRAAQSSAPAAQLAGKMRELILEHARPQAA